MTDIRDTNIQLEINDWQCEFELLSLESFRLIKEPNKKKVIQIQESIMATCYPTASPPHQVKFSTSCQNMDGPLEGEWDKKKLKDITSIILKKLIKPILPVLEKISPAKFHSDKVHIIF